MFTKFTASNWLLAAVAAWAIGVAIVAMTGFGGRYSLHPPNLALAPSLPAAAVESGPPPMGPLEMYAEAANRPLFNPDRKPALAMVGNDSQAQQPLNVVLTSIILTPTLHMAIVHDTASGKSLRVREGQVLEGGPSGWKLVSVSRQQAVFESSQGRNTLDLRVFNGQGGEPPTPNGLTPQAVSTTNTNSVQAIPSQSGVGRTSPPAMMLANSPTKDDSAARQAADAASRAQAEAIRQRIEARRKQMQGANGAVSPPSDKEL